VKTGVQSISKTNRSTKRSIGFWPGDEESYLGRSLLLFFIKNPEKGKVKQGWPSAIGDKMAVKLYKRFLLEMLFTLNGGTFIFYLCYSPESPLSNLKDWLGDDYLYMPQTGEDLGERMKNGFVEAISMNFKKGGPDRQVIFLICHSSLSRKAFTLSRKKTQ